MLELKYAPCWLGYSSECISPNLPTFRSYELLATHLHSCMELQYATKFLPPLLEFLVHARMFNLQVFNRQCLHCDRQVVTAQSYVRVLNLIQHFFKWQSLMATRTTGPWIYILFIWYTNALKYEICFVISILLTDGNHLPHQGERH